MRFLLDTAVFIFAVESPERLSRRAAALFGSPDDTLELSSVSLVEITTKTSIGKLTMGRLAVQRGLEDSRVQVLTYTSEHAFKLFDLPRHHRDPFDRQIIAQALAEQIPVVTPDRDFRLYDDLEVIW